MNLLKDFYLRKPLVLILLSALFFRMISAFFSRGYGMIDDHFLVIEIVQSWIDGFNGDGWLPDANNPNSKPAGFSMLYPGSQYYMLMFFEKIGVMLPEYKMVLVRIVHAFFSLLVVFYGYKIAEKLDGKTSAAYVGWILALIWFMPMMSVRNLVEMVCIVPLIYATWLIVSAKPNQYSLFLLAGIMAGLAFSVRFQTSTFIAGLGLVLFFQKRWVHCLAMGAGLLFSILVVQGGVDYIVWGKPFIQFEEYTSFNLTNAYNYIIGPWYNYLLLIPGLLIPPYGLFLFFGFFLIARKYPLLFYPTVLFVFFHSLFPNKQERFILPIVPFVVIAGVIGWKKFVETSAFWNSKLSLLNFSFKFSVIANFILLSFLTPASTRTGLMDSMIFLSDKENTDWLVVENTNTTDDVLLPKFYLRNWNMAYSILKSNYTVAQFKANIENSPTYKSNKRFQYVLFGQEENLKLRLADFEKSFGKLHFLTHIKSSYLDRFMHWLNPYGNKSQDYFIYELK